jgi:hypothetical protein
LTVVFIWKPTTKRQSGTLFGSGEVYGTVSRGKRLWPAPCALPAPSRAAGCAARGPALRGGRVRDPEARPVRALSARWRLEVARLDESMPAIVPVAPFAQIATRPLYPAS